MMNQPSLEIEEKGLIKGELPGSCLKIIFGASGDLAHRELLPALYSLRTHKLVTEPWAIIGFDVKEFDDNSFRKEMESAVKTYGEYEQESWNEFAMHLYYIQGDFSKAESFIKLSEKINEVRSKEKIPDNLLFHLATPQRFYGTIINGLKAAVLAGGQGTGWRRIIIEKPFGDSRITAIELDKRIHDSFKEEQVYRVDHFLGKETVQNMLVFRFANPGFEPVWNRNFIDSVQITAGEDIGIGTRGAFYEKTGEISRRAHHRQFDRPQLPVQQLVQRLCRLHRLRPPDSFSGGVFASVGRRQRGERPLPTDKPLERRQLRRPFPPSPAAFDQPGRRSWSCRSPAHADERPQLPHARRTHSVPRAQAPAFHRLPGAR